MRYDPEIISELGEDMKYILDAELKNGNTITETSRVWPIENGLNVWLKRSFAKDYCSVSSDLKYRYLGDPHNGEAEYCNPQTKQLITVWGR